MIGGILTSFLLELLVYPPVYQIWKWNFEVNPPAFRRDGVLARTQFDKRKAARILGISLASLYRKLGERRISDPPLQN